MAEYNKNVIPNKMSTTATNHSAQCGTSLLSDV